MQSAVIVGIDARSVDVICTVAPGLPAFDLLGMSELAVREARVRVRSAIRTTGLPFPRTHVTVTLVPEDMRKAGTSFDLPIALSVLDVGIGDGYMAFGELSLAGDLRPVMGITSVAELCREQGLTLLCAPDNAAEALAVGADVRSAATLAEMVACLRGRQPWQLPPPPREVAIPSTPLCWSDVRGHAQAKRALEVAVAGGHHTLLIGAPGCGKTMLARRLPTIMPDMTPSEAAEVRKIRSVAGLDQTPTRPFRAPHHTASASALVGGGTTPKPGEATLAHRGVLFLDELAEFPASVLHTVRAVMDDGAVTVRGVQFPAQCIVVGATTPCACGHTGSTVRECACSEQQLERYHARLDPVRGAFDIQLQVPIVSPNTLRYSPPGETSAVVRERIAKAWALRARGLQPAPMPVSSRVHRVAQTIANLAGEDLALVHVAEALMLCGETT